MIFVGIDTGTHTGVAIWDTKTNRLLSLECVGILEAIDIVKVLAARDADRLFVSYEDAHQRQWIPRMGGYKAEIGRAKGAGSVERDCAIWEDFLTATKIRHQAIAPKDNTTKMSAEMFSLRTGWKGRTNEHERDAAMLYFARPNLNWIFEHE